MAVVQATLQIDGMTCMGCVNSIKKAVAAMQDVHNLTVDLQKGTATVDFDDHKISLENIKQAIDDAGFEVKS